MRSRKWWIVFSAAVVIVLLIGIAFQSTQSIKVVGIGESVVGSDGLRLSTSVNATEIKIGERVNISVSVVNTRSASNVVPAQMVFGQDDQWPFFGIPVSTWPECTREFPALSWPLPVNVVILKGNFTLQELHDIANSAFRVFCGPIGGVIIWYYTFRPNSNLLNITFQAGGGVGNFDKGPFLVSSHFTVDGYWNLTSLAKVNGPPTFCVPPIPLACSPPPSAPFTAGVYTVGVSDEWGESNILHFSVVK